MTENEAQQRIISKGVRVPLIVGTYAFGIVVGQFAEAALARPLDEDGWIPGGAGETEVAAALAVTCGLVARVPAPRHPVAFIVMGSLSAPLWALYGAHLLGGPASGGARSVVASAMGLVFGLWVAYALAGPRPRDPGYAPTFAATPFALALTWGFFFGLFFAVLLDYATAWHHGAYPRLPLPWGFDWGVAAVVAVSVAAVCGRMSSAHVWRSGSGMLWMIVLAGVSGAGAGLPIANLGAAVWMLSGATLGMRSVEAFWRGERLRAGRAWGQFMLVFRNAVGRSIAWKVSVVAALLVVVAIFSAVRLMGDEEPRYEYPASAALYWERNCGLSSEDECECAWSAIQDQIPYGDWEYFTFHQSGTRAGAARSERIDDRLTQIVAECRS